jgi:hypothetical protein
VAVGAPVSAASDRDSSIINPTKGGFMESMLLDAAGHRGSPATMPGYYRGPADCASRRTADRRANEPAVGNTAGRRGRTRRNGERSANAGSGDVPLLRLSGCGSETDADAAAVLVLASFGSWASTSGVDVGPDRFARDMRVIRAEQDE